MLQQNSDYFFSSPMIYFGSFQQIDEDEEIDDKWEETIHPFILEIDPKHPLQQQTIGLYLQWFDS